ncbi:hypothetical protein DSM3645_05090 [Blastopirellula marina DSM 3645]|uniref:Uncharacterized protein n=1 Tax=Blastopirellula marina DSM 3645 TaxID=314230 RepID=A3ZTP1_9BACT|nr:hypothetical protein DSM3645_05090 [Blastopirellula marina DSM 3645]
MAAMSQKIVAQTAIWRQVRSLLEWSRML